MRKIKIILVLIGCVSLFQYTYRKIQNKISKKIEIKEEPSFYLINVLDKEEFNDAHIINSIHVPFENINTFLDTLETKTIPLIFYCANYFCTSSDEAALIASKKGFKSIFVYSGGMAEWYQASKKDPQFEYIGPAQSDYLNIVIFNKEEKINETETPQKEKNKNINKISINNLQKILKEGTIKE